MDDVKEFFFDTYALVEIAKGSPRYQPYEREVIIYLTRLNLMEFHYSILRTVGKEEADRLYERFLPYVVEITDTIIKKANELKLQYRERHLSYIDCLGYVMAKMLRIKFLTGDEQFKDMDNVEFVK